MIENGFDIANVTVTTIPGRGSAAREAEHRIIASILRLVPGDVCLAGQDNAGPDLLHLGNVVHLNPDGYHSEHLTDFGYHPDRIAIGIPTRPVEAAAE